MLRVLYLSPPWITALLWWRGLRNSMKLWAMPCRATQNGQVMGESSDKMQSTGKGNGKPLQYSCCKTPWTVWKGKQIWHWKMSPSGWKVSNMLPGKSRDIAPEGMKRLSQAKTMLSCGCDWWWKEGLMLWREILHRNLVCWVHESR